MWLISLHNNKKHTLTRIAFVRNIDNIKTITDYLFKNYKISFDDSNIIHNNNNVYIIRGKNNANTNNNKIFSLVCEYLPLLLDKDVSLFNEDNKNNLKL